MSVSLRGAAQSQIKIREIQVFDRIEGTDGGCKLVDEDRMNKAGCNKVASCAFDISFVCKSGL